jgi:glycosyltransferase involved in cell wall biosynthesis
MSTVAAVLPAFNASAYIAAALDSVRAQTRPPDEIIVADDASTDDTVDAVETWSRTVGMPCRVVRLEKNGGAAASRNAGIRSARSDLIAMLDADDVWLPNMIERLAGALDAAPASVLSFGLREYFDDQGALGEYQGTDRIARHLGNLEHGSSHLLRPEAAFLLNVESAVTSCSAAVVRRQAALDCGLFDPAFRTSQDREFVLRLSRLGSFTFISEPVSLYRLHGSNTTHGRHAVRNALNGLQVLAKVYRDRARLSLTPSETEATRSAMDRAARGVLYVASTRGLDSYLCARREVRNTAANPGRLDLRPIVRACWRSLFVDHGLSGSEPAKSGMP